MAAVRKGSQEPTFQRLGKSAGSFGDDAINLFEQYGVKFLPWQKEQMRHYLAYDDYGQRAAMTLGLTVPRQNGKSYAARFYAIWCAAVEGKTVVYTAHNGSTTNEMFEAIVNFVEGNKDFSDKLRRRHGKVAGVVRAGGKEGVYFSNGGSIRVNTRTNGGWRGGTFDVIIIDEAQELTEAQYDALMPTSIAADSGDPQEIYLGTPPNEKCPGTVFRRMHKSAHSHKESTAWWIEWAAEEITDTLDEEMWYRCCPMLGYRIKRRTMAEKAANNIENKDGFFREYLGWWSPIDTPLPPVLSAKDWDACKVKQSTTEGVVSYGVQFDQDGKFGCIAVCVRPAGDLRPFVEVVDLRSTARGVTWLSNWISARKDKCAVTVIDGKAKASALGEKLRKAGFTKKAVQECSTTDLISACSMFADAVESGDIAHAGQDGLRESATKCTKRTIGSQGGWAFDENGGSDPLPVEACALAYFGAMTTKRNPNRKMRLL